MVCLVAAISGFAQVTIPKWWGHAVHDEAKILSQSEIDAIEANIQAHEDSTTNQIAVLIIPSLQGEILEELSLRVAQEWKLGTAGNDNGVLLLIAVDDRKMRIEVGQGLEGVLTDATSNQIIRNVIAPSFRDQQYGKGVKEGVDAIIGAIQGEYSADSDGAETLTGPEKIIMGLIVVVVLGVFTFLGVFIKGCMGWFLYAFLIPFYAIFPTVIMGRSTGFTLLAIYLIGYPIARILLPKTSWGKRFGTSMGKGSGGGWTSGGGWFSGSSGGGWSGGGGFSGGGGSFGGGGSSGSW